MRVAEVLDGTVVLSGGDYIDRRYIESIGRKISHVGDIVVTTKGTVGRAARITGDSEGLAYSPQLCFFRVLRTDVLDPDWLYCWFRSPLFAMQARRVQGQTDMAPYINLSDIGNLRLEIPTTEEQRSSSRVVTVLDDKIQANRRASAVADELWQAKLAQLMSCAKSERLPNGWQKRPLSKLANFINGGAFTKNASGSGRMVVRIAELNGGPGSSTVYSDIAVDERHLARPGDLLFAWSGSLKVARWFRDEAVINQHIFKVVPADGVPLWLVHEHLLRLLPRYKGVASDKATTMGHIRRQDLDEQVLVPPPELLAELNETVGPLWLRALAAERENLLLVELRDTLLPKLISGELRVRDAADELEGVG